MQLFLDVEGRVEEVEEKSDEMKRLTPANDFAGVFERVGVRAPPSGIKARAFAIHESVSLSSDTFLCVPAIYISI